MTLGNDVEVAAIGESRFGAGKDVALFACVFVGTGIGGALLQDGVRFGGASTRDVNGNPSYTGSTDLKPTTLLIKEVRLVEDFERVLVWGVGLDHLICPQITELAGPVRVVLDFASSP